MYRESSRTIQPHPPRLFDSCQHRSIFQWLGRSGHTLKVAGVILSFAGKGHLGLAVLQLINDFAVGHIAHLVILLYDNSLGITDTTFATGHHRITSVIGGADVAVDSSPTVLTFAGFAFSRWTIDAIR